MLPKNYPKVLTFGYLSDYPKMLTVYLLHYPNRSRGRASKLYPQNFTLKFRKTEEERKKTEERENRTEGRRKRKDERRKKKKR